MSRANKPYQIYWRISKKTGQPVDKRPFGVRTIGANGEPLNSAQGFTRKESAIVNIQATVRAANPNATDEEIGTLIEDQTK